VIILTDAIIGQMAEPLEVRAIDFGSLPPKEWAIGGKGYHHDGKRRLICCAQGQIPIEPFTNYLTLTQHLYNKYKAMEEEARHDAYLTQDASLILVAYGYAARVSKEAINWARDEGMKVGLLRPITLYPFPYDPIREKASEGCQFLVVEDSLGQMIEDVRLGVDGKAEVYFLGVLARHMPTDAGMILPTAVLKEIRRIYKG
jgi:2-oxoglutarate ferredoxin oxidoreductase subunit alpha